MELIVLKQTLKTKWKRFVCIYGITILLGVILGNLVVYLVCPIHVNGESMEPTLTDGQLIFCSEALKGRIEKGDIITAMISPKMKFPKEKLTKDGKLSVVKRVIGAPGDTVEIRDNVVYVNGKQIDEPYIKEPMRTNDCTCKLKADEWFVMGDNRNHSLDSRKLGSIRTEEIQEFVLMW